MPGDLVKPRFDNVINIIFENKKDVKQYFLSELVHSPVYSFERVFIITCVDEMMLVMNDKGFIGWTEIDYYEKV